MKIVFCTSFLNETIEIEVNNLAQVVDYISNNNESLFQQLEETKCGWALVDSQNPENTIFLNPHITGSDFSGFDTVVVFENIEGEALFSTLIAALAVSLTGSLLTAGAALIAANIIVGLAVVIGSSLLMYGLRMLMTPNQDMNAGDGASQRKNLMLNGIPNVDEQGGALPVVLGECFFGAVKVGQNVSTVDIAVSGNDIDLDKTIPEIPKSTIKAHGDGNWYRVQ